MRSRGVTSITLGINVTNTLSIVFYHRENSNIDMRNVRARSLTLLEDFFRGERGGRRIFVHLLGWGSQGSFVGREIQSVNIHLIKDNIYFANWRLWDRIAITDEITRGLIWVICTRSKAWKHWLFFEKLHVLKNTYKNITLEEVAEGKYEKHRLK